MGVSIAREVYSFRFQPTVPILTCHLFGVRVQGWTQAPLGKKKRGEFFFLMCAKKNCFVCEMLQG